MLYLVEHQVTSFLLSSVMLYLVEHQVTSFLLSSVMLYLVEHQVTYFLLSSVMLYLVRIREPLPLGLHEQFPDCSLSKRWDCCEPRPLHRLCGRSAVDSS